MPDKLALEIATPERLILAVEADEVVLPSVEGSMGALPGHAPLLAILGVGEVSYRVGAQRRFLAVSGGFAEVLPASVQVLAETCEPAEQIDLERARRAEERARERLAAREEAVDLGRAQAALARALCRLQIGSRAQD